MNKRILIGFFLGIIFSNTFLFAQQPADSSAFELKAFFEQVLATHPVVKQAYLVSESGKQELRLARGEFDPKLLSNFSSKEYKGKNYYRKWDTDLKIPLWTGTDLKIGYETNSGDNLSDESFVPPEGLLSAGIAIPLGQGLLIDRRRAVLRQAQFFTKIAENEQIKMINKIVLQAAKDYWYWYDAYNQFLINKKGFDLAKFRFESVVERVKQGEEAGIDSVEAKITLQQREIDYRYSEVALANARLLLSNHLWDENANPLELEPEAVPSTNIGLSGNTAKLEELLELARQKHPEIEKLRWKGKQLNTQLRLDREMLKPFFTVQYDFLASPHWFSEKTEDQKYINQSNKIGFDFAFPLFLRKERSKIQLTTIKLKDNYWEQLETNRQIENNLRIVFNELQNTEQLLRLQEEMVVNYRILVAGEITKFENGESTLFYVNVREGKMLESEQKLVVLKAKYAKLKAELLWAAGQIPSAE